jgi:hypothetical protein
MAVAGLRALDGQGDVALLGVLPMLEVGTKLEVAARGVWNFEMGRLMQESAILAADFVLKTTPVSAPVRARFAAALAKRGGPDGMRRAFAIRRAGVAEASGSLGGASLYWRDTPVEFFLRATGWIHPLAFNGQAVLNRWDRLFADLEELAVKRDSAGTARRVAEFMAAEKQVTFKNAGGNWFSWNIERRLALKDSGERVVQRYWATEDRRAALLQRLQQPAGAAEQPAK